MARNSVAANLLMIIFMVGGLIIATQVTQEVFPEFDTDIVSISVPYPGASPEEVEQGVILSVEDRVRGLDGIKDVTSNAYEGSASVLVELVTSVNPYKALQDIKNEIDRIQSFPEDAERPIVSLIENKRKVVALVVYGDQEEQALRDLAEKIRDELLQIDGITQVELSAIRDLEIAIEIPAQTLREYSLTLDAVAATIRRMAIELPGGTVRTQAGQILLRTQERRDRGLEYRDIPITSAPDGTVVTLGDIAAIHDGFEESDQEAWFNGKRAVRVDVYRVGNETPQSVSRAVDGFAEGLRPSLPDDVGLMLWEDRSEIYTDRMNLLLKNAALGLLLVLLLLGLFLEARLAFWVTLGIPISILGAFLFIPVTGATINMISLFAFIVSLGIVVDDAVVMGENIYDKREQGLSVKDAAPVGAVDIAMPVIFAVLTNIVAFMPLFFVPGISGKFFRQIPSITVAVFLVSLIEALFVLPAHLSHEPKKRKIFDILDVPRKKAAAKLDRFIKNLYAPLVALLIKYRYATFAAGFAMLFLAGGVVGGGHLRFSFLPKIDSEVVTAQATLPVGVPMEQSRVVLKELIEKAQMALKYNGGEQISRGIYGQIGKAFLRHGPGPSIGAGGGSHIVAVQVYLVPADRRDISGREFSREWRKQVGDIVGVETLVFNAETGASEGAAIDVSLNHRSRDTLEQAATELAEVLENYAGVTDIDNGFSLGKQQLSFKLTPEAQSLGVTSVELARQVRSSFYGAEALRQQRGRNEIKVIVRLPREERESINTLEQFVVRTPQGGEIPFLSAAKVEQGRSYTEILRQDGRRVISVTAEVDSEISNADKILDKLTREDIPKLQRKYPGLSYGFKGAKEAQRESMSSLKTGFAIAMLVIYALLAVPFKSYVQPIIVMLSIPFGIIGAVLGHLLLGYQLSIISMFGLIALSGVVVNDSLVLVVTANRMREEEGYDATTAVQLAGQRRFRPILLTSLTTFLGLAPMIFETSLQARFLIPMAISLGFGVLFSTVIILGIVPAAYLIVEDLKNWKSVFRTS
jgi:multidrug efflux pump subunit AcrB